MDTKKVIFNLCLFFLCAMAGKAGAISFVQVNSAVPQTPQSVVSVPFNSAQTEGNLNVVVVGWNDSWSVESRHHSSAD